MIYVSPNGNDSNPGTVTKPLATLAAARDAVRNLKKAGLQRPVEVIVQAGVYYLGEPLVFTPQDSGSASCPITYRAADRAKVIVSGGMPITGWRKRRAHLWSASVPAGIDFRLLRVGDAWAIRARHPNFDAAHPYTGGWLFADWGGKPWERGQFNIGVQNTHNVNDRLTWKIQAPAEGTYRVWMRYGHKMKDYKVDDMAGRTALRVNGGDPVLLQNLPDTGDWGKFRWSHVADIHLHAGECEIQWVNLKGGGINFDALALTDDPSWDPDEAISSHTWWGACDIQAPAQGKHLLIIQAEACDKADGLDIRVPQPTPPGTTKDMTIRPGDIARLTDPRSAEVHIFIAWGWVNAIIPIGEIDYSRRRIIFAGEGASQDVRIGNRYFIENAREFLDAPNEWFLDKKTGEVVYITEHPDFPQLPIVAANLDRLIVLEGDPERGQFVEHLAFEGFQFRDTTYHLTREYYFPQDAVVVMSGARHCKVDACEFRRCGGYALKLMQRSEQCTFSRNHIHHVGQGGVIMVGGTKEQSHHCSVVGNTMEHLGLIYKHVAGVYVTHGSDHYIAHNRITDVPRYGISLKSMGEERLSHRNVVEFNEILRSNLETNDTGAFESLGYERRDSGNVVRYNLMLDSIGLATTSEGRIVTPYFTWGVYLDDYSSGTIVYGNIIARTMNGGINIHGGQNNTIENNIFVEGHDHQVRLQPRDDFMKGNKFLRNIVVYSRPEAHLIFSWWNKRDVFAECDYNLYWLKGADLRTLMTKNTPEGTFAQWIAAGNDIHSVVADPLFVNAERDDYRLKPDSPAFTLGFKPIPVEKIGPKGWK